MSVNAHFRIGQDRAKAILEQVEAVVATWRQEGRALGMATHELESFTDAFEHQERQAVQRLVR
jgi:serine/threonine-protein kinase HipA